MRLFLPFGVLILVVANRTSAVRNDVQIAPSASKKIVNVAIPTSGKACTKKVTFPIKSFTGVKGYPWMTEVFGIPIIGTEKFKTSGKMQFAASILAELMDNDNDGCADDPNVLAALLKKMKNDFGGPPTKRSLFLINKHTDPWADKTVEALAGLGYTRRQFTYLDECLPNKAGLKASAEKDATMEEFLHFINDDGHKLAYPTIFGMSYTSQSTLTNAMDIARGKKIKITPATKAGYPTKAWYKYTDTTCNYACQVTEYLWWGYVAYSGIGNGLVGNQEFENEYPYLGQTTFKAKDVGLTKMFKDSEDKTAVYRLPTRPVDGTYNGCKTCTGGKNHGGN